MEAIRKRTEKRWAKRRTTVETKKKGGDFDFSAFYSIQ